MKIEVTKTDIDFGESRNTQSCPIALSLKRVVKPEFTPTVLTHHAEIQQIRENFKVIKAEIDLPPEATEFIKRYDDFESSATVEPFSFELNIPQEYLNA